MTDDLNEKHQAHLHNQEYPERFNGAEDADSPNPQTKPQLRYEQYIETLDSRSTIFNRPAKRRRRNYLILGAIILVLLLVLLLIRHFI